jgi:hypothetical protein
VSATTRRARALAASFALASAACAPDFADAPWLVDAPRVLAVRADPAEATPGSAVRFTALVAVSPSAQPPPVAWSFCRTPRPLTTANVVSDDCVGPSLPVLASGSVVTLATPADGCAVFGPDAPGRQRPVAPDATGGFYQPVRADLAGAPPAIALARIRCNLPSASSAAATLFAQSYVANANPVIASVRASSGRGSASFDAVPAGARVELEAQWTAESAETYAYYDATDDAVGSKREAIDVAWYASAGVLDQAATGRASDDSAVASDNGWTAPAQPGAATLWVVVRDDRGGVAFETVDVTVVAGP